jgi:hypothetical protein
MMFASYTTEVFFRLRIARIRRGHTLTYNGHLTPVKPLGAILELSRRLSGAIISTYFDPLVERFVIHPLILPSFALAVLPFLVSCSGHTAGQLGSRRELVELLPIELDSRNPQQKEFGRLEFLNGFELRSHDPRFGGLSGITIGSDGRLYFVSDAGYWVSAQMVLDSDARLLDLTDWMIHPLLSTTGTPVTDPLQDAEALARAPDGSFMVAFENVHRIWRYPPPPVTFYSLPLPVSIPMEVLRAPSNGGLEGITVFSDGRLLALTEEFQNRDGSFKGWLIEGERFFELSYLPSEGFRVTDCAALSNGDVLVLERRYVPLGILSARLKLVRATTIQPGSKLVGEELIKLEYPLEVDNFEGVAVQEDPHNGTIIYIVSDDNYHPLERTLLLQFRLNQTPK